MNDPDGAGGRPDSPATDDEARLGARLDALGEKLAARRAQSGNDNRGTNRGAPDGKGYGLGIRLVTDLVAGVLVGGAIGWFVDGWLGTSPWGLIVLLLLGVAAGVFNALRSAGLVRESPTRQSRSGGDEEG